MADGDLTAKAEMAASVPSQAFKAMIYKHFSWLSQSLQSYVDEL